MIDLLYEKQGSYLQGREDQAVETAKGMLAENLSIEVIERVTKLTKEQVLKLKAKVEKEQRLAK